MVVLLKVLLLLLLPLLLLALPSDVLEVMRTLAQLQQQLQPQPQLQPANQQNSFHAWTQHIAGNLSQLQQQRVAQNVRWLQTPKSARQLLQLHELLIPPSNTFELQLWLSYYWQLKRAQRLDAVLLQHFALVLRQLRQQQAQPWNAQLQNMLQSLPHTLQVLLHSRWLCLLHARQLVYAGAAPAQLELGAGNCSRWQITQQESRWLRLQNACKAQAVWYVNMLQQPARHVHLLLSEPSGKALSYCVSPRRAYYGTAAGLNSMDCQWQLNDCSRLVAE